MNHGEVILVFHQYAYLGKGPSIYSSGQIECTGHDHCDRSAVVGGRQRMVISSGNHECVTPFNVQRGLVRMNLRPYMDDEWDTLPHLTVTPDMEWDPSVLDHVWPEDTFPPSELPASKHFRVPFTPVGDYANRCQVNSLFGPGKNSPDHAPDDPLESIVEDCVIASLDKRLNAPQHGWRT